MTGKRLAPLVLFFVMFVQPLPPHQSAPVFSLATSYLTMDSFGLNLKFYCGWREGHRSTKTLSIFRIAASQVTVNLSKPVWTWCLWEWCQEMWVQPWESITTGMV